VRARQLGLATATPRRCDDAHREAVADRALQSLRDQIGGSEETRGVVAAFGQHRVAPQREKAILDELPGQQAIGVDQPLDCLWRRRAEQVVEDGVGIKSWRCGAELPRVLIRLLPPSVAPCMREDLRPRARRS
jgi:hypothetical protein